MRRFARLMGEVMAALLALALAALCAWAMLGALRLVAASLCAVVAVVSWA